MKADQVNLFREYSELRATSPNCKRIEVIETLLVQMNQGLIFYVARRYPAIWQYQSEIKTVGMANLLKAIRTYDPSLGDFGPYAVQQLRSSEGLQSIQRFHACGPIKIPHNAFVSYLTEKKNQANDPDSEFSEECQAVDSAISNLSRFGEETEGMSLEETVEQSTFAGPSAMIEHKQARKALYDVLGTLDGREKQVIYLLFGMEEETEAMDLRSVGKILSISHEMVRKIRDKALDRLKKRLAPQF